MYVFKAIKDQLLVDLRALYPTLTDAQVTLLMSSELDLVSEAPQVILHAFRPVYKRGATGGYQGFEIPDKPTRYRHVANPRIYDLIFTVTLVSKLDWAVTNMVERLMEFCHRSRLMEVTFGEGAEAFTLGFAIGVRSDPRDLTVDNDPGLKVWEMDLAVLDIPIYDSESSEGALITDISGQTVDGHSTDTPAEIERETMDTISIVAPAE